MADLQWFPLYPADFLTSRKTRKMDAEEIGIFFLLLMEQFLGGPIPDNEFEIEEMGRSPWSKVQPVLQAHFVLTDEGWINTRLWEESERAHSKIDARSKAGKAGAAARWGTKPKPVPDKPPVPTKEDGNRNATADATALPSQSDTNGLLEDRTIQDKQESTSEKPKKKRAKEPEDGVILIRWDLLTPGKRGYKKIERSYFDDVMFVCKESTPWTENLVIETQEDLEAWTT